MQARSRTVSCGTGEETPPQDARKSIPSSPSRDVNRLFEDFFRGFDLRPLRMAEEKWARSARR